MQSAVLVERRRDIRVMSVVGVCHFFSHFYQLAMPPLFVMINAAQGYSLERLSILVSVFFAVSFAFQIPVGFFVDRFGARSILMAGMALMAGATALYGIFPAYEAMVVFAVLGGLGNSVFHPADYSILNGSVTRARLGKAFSVHNLGGFVGYAVAPVLMAWMGLTFGWQTAAVAAGAAGLLVLVVSIALSGDFRDSSHARREVAAQNTLRQDFGLLLKPAPLLCLLFFTLLAGGQLGVQFFADKVYYLAHEVAPVLGNSFISAFVIGALTGIIAGGVVADRIANPLRLTFFSLLTCAALVLILALSPPDTSLVFAVIAAAGFFFGFGFASRDLVVSSIAPPEASGKMFGFVFSGLDMGSALAPLIYGALLGAVLPLTVFYVACVLIAISAFTVYAAGMSVERRPARTG